MPNSNDLSENLMSLQSHILLEEAKFPTASGDFTWIISAISLAAKSIANQVRRARLSGAIGRIGETNVQGEEQQKLDVIANKAIIRVLGTRQVAAGYVLYGSSTIFVLTTGNGVALFELDPYIGSFLLVKDKLRIPDTNKVYSVNEAYRESFPDGYRRYLDWAHQNGYSSRYIGSMVADVHRTLLTGGVFMYPPTKKNPEGKLRYLYEASPMAMIIEQAGGLAYSGSKRTVEHQPRQVHERVPVLLGSRGEVEKVREFVG